MGFFETFKDLTNPNPNVAKSNSNTTSSVNPEPQVTRREATPANDKNNAAPVAEVKPANPEQQATRRKATIIETSKAEIEAEEVKISKMKAELADLENQLRLVRIAESKGSGDLKKIFVSRIEKLNNTISELQADIAIAEAALPDKKALAEAEKLLAEIEEAEKAKEKAKENIMKSNLPACIESLDSTHMTALVEIMLNAGKKTNMATLVKAIQATAPTKKA